MNSVLGLKHSKCQNYKEFPWSNATALKGFLASGRVEQILFCHLNFLKQAYASFLYNLIKLPTLSMAIKGNYKDPYDQTCK